MSKFLALYRVTRKCAQTEEGVKTSSLIGYGILGIVVVALLGVAGYYVGVLLPAVAMMMPDTDVPTSLFTIVFWFSGIFILFTALQKLLGTMFMSSDVDILAAMPLSSGQIAMTRVMSCVPYAYATTACIIVPFTIGYMVSTGFDAMTLVAAVLGVILVPAGLISIVAILLTLVMKVFRQVRNRDMLTVLGAIGAIVLVVAFNVLTNSVTEASLSDGDKAAGLISTIASISNIAWSLPFAACLGQALSGGPIYLLGAIAITAALIGLMYALLSLLYLPAALSMADARSSSKAIDDEKLERGSASRSIDRALFLKEAKAYFKETNYIQSWAFAIALPLIFLVMAIMGANDGSAPSGFIGAVIDADKLPLAYSILVGVAMAISTVAIASAASAAGTSCISREGESFDFMKTCPVEYRIQINAKRKVAMIPLAIAAVVFEAACFVIAATYGVFSIAALVAALITDVFVVVLFANLQIRTGARKADLHWSNAQTAVKNTGLWLAIGLIVFIVFSVPAYLIGLLGLELDAMGLTLWIYIGTGVVVVLIALAAFLTTKPALRYAAEKVEMLS